MLSEVHKADAAKPCRVKNDFSDISVSKKGDLMIRNDRFKSRVRSSQKVSPDSIPAHRTLTVFSHRPKSYSRLTMIRCTAPEYAA